MARPELPQLDERPLFADQMELIQQSADTPELKARHDHAFSIVVQGLSRRLEHYAAFLTDSYVDAEDIAQRALMNGWVHRSKYNPAKGTPTSWFMAITRNLSYKHNRARKHQRAAQPHQISLNADGADAIFVTDAPAPETDPHAQVQAHVAFGKIMGAAAEEARDGNANRVNSRYPELVNMVMSGAEQDEIAKAFGITKGNARVKKHRVRERIQERVGEDIVELFDEAA